MTIALIGVGALMIGAVVVLSIVWSRPVRPGTEPPASEAPAEAPAEKRANEDPSTYDNVSGAGFVLALIAIMAIPASLFLPLFGSCYGSDPAYVCSQEGGEVVSRILSYGTIGCAAMGLLAPVFTAGWGRAASLLWLRLCLTGQAIAILLTFTLMKV